VRESDGLAKSSRNRYLSEEERAAAAALPDAMKAALAGIGKGEPVAQALARLQERLLAAGFASVDYAGLADAQSLEPVASWPSGGPARLLVAARIGGTRLIDNMGIE
jgi:pantoate--beta-alanine ligase